MLRNLILGILLISSQGVFAQDTRDNTVIEKYGPRRQISTIVYMGLAGAVLGLSTLSFYGRPQDKLTNIPIGFGAGVIIGTIYMTYQAATNPNEFYKQTSFEPDLKLNTYRPLLVSDYYLPPQRPDFSYTWTF